MKRFQQAWEGKMTGNLFLRTSVILLVVGLFGGVVMGATEDFALAPAHAHLNLAGGVLMFLAGLFYNSRPAMPKLTATHYGLHVLGGVLLPVGIAGHILKQPWGVPVVSAGSLIMMAAMLVFAFNVFKGTGKAA